MTLENIARFVAIALIIALTVISSHNRISKVNKLLEAQAQGKKWLACGNYLIPPGRWKIVKDGSYYIVVLESLTKGLFKIYDIKNCRTVNHIPTFLAVDPCERCPDPKEKKTTGGVRSEKRGPF